MAGVALGSLLSACGGPARPPSTAPTSPDELALVLDDARHPCLVQRPDTDEPAGEIFVETVLLDVPRDAAANARATDLLQLAELPDIRLLATPHLLGKFNVVTTMNVAEHWGVLDRAIFSHASFLPRHADNGQLVLQLELGFSLPNADPAKIPSIANVSLPIVTRYGQPTLASSTHPADPKRALLAIVKAYWIRNNEDLRTLFECKMRVHQRAIERH